MLCFSYSSVRRSLRKKARNPNDTPKKDDTEDKPEIEETERPSIYGEIDKTLE